MGSSELLSKVSKIGEVLNDPKLPLNDRFRALFTLKSIGGEEAINCIGKCFKDQSALLKHELAYCLGQMQDVRALPLLEKVLRDNNQEPMVRHEAGEAIGAIGCSSSLPMLKEFVNDPSPEVAETCQLAIERIKYVQKGESLNTESPYNSIDPTPTEKEKNVDELITVFLNDNADLFSRYKAMFALRNLNTSEAVAGLCKGLFKGSALFRHEVAFVLGQIRSKEAVSSLEQVLKNSSENEMVRHEAAEALGSIATENSKEILKKYLKDNCRVVAESCVIGLDMADHENSSHFQYANTASTV